MRSEYALLDEVTACAAKFNPKRFRPNPPSLVFKHLRSDSLPPGRVQGLSFGSYCAPLCSPDLAAVQNSGFVHPVPVPIPIAAIKRSRAATSDPVQHCRPRKLSLALRQLQRPGREHCAIRHALNITSGFLYEAVWETVSAQGQTGGTGLCCECRINVGPQTLLHAGRLSTVGCRGFRN
jgi:hypothetical protein